MLKNVLKNFIFTLLFFACVFSTCNVFAAGNYGDLESRIDKNKQMIESSNNMSSIAIGRYSDKYLKDLYETNYKGLNVSQQNKIQNFADNIILEGNNELSKMDKLLKFHDWIVDNFYYYATPNKISSLGSNCDNPYYLLTYEYDVYGTVRSRGNGYSAMMIALARSQGMPARQVGGYFNKDARGNYINWGSNITSSNINNKWVQVYVDGSWITINAYADSYQTYNGITGEYQKDSNFDINYKHDYFNPTVEELSKTHIAFTYYAGSKELKYVGSSYERTKVTRFLNKKYNNKSNGKRVNSSYSPSYANTWFIKGTSSLGDGYGRFSKIYWPSDKNLYGALDLSGFGGLKILSVPNNKITSLSLSNSPAIQKVYVQNNKMTKIVVTGSKNLTYLSAKTNPTTYVKYNFGKTKRTAIIKAGTGGTVSVRYSKTSSGKHKHELTAVSKTGYTFKGWYSGSKRISKNKSISVYNTQSFTYTAKYEKKTYIYISISKQKLWYYKKGVLVKSSNIVTGMKGEHDTPKGNYTILGKARDAYLIGDDYKVFVDYWMLIDRRKQIGLHDASWRWDFGGSIYKYNGSHGCVNLPYSVAKYLYYNAPVGTSVIIK